MREESVLASAAWDLDAHASPRAILFADLVDSVRLYERFEARASEVLRLNGTSQAARVLARRLYNPLCGRLTAGLSTVLSPHEHGLEAVQLATQEEPDCLMTPNRD